ncbi:hypothetical protein RRF57_000402 [Xylaria bambusicola]|uniref:Uncharacterized protein n=1 Tax=Xylaria bambusicola TaxID=326684 RepID=A0AAN7UC32_9PEZI
MRFSKNANLSTDTFSCVAVIASNDDYSDTSILALFDCIGNFRSRGIKHAYEAEQRKVLFQLGIMSRSLSGVDQGVRSDVIQASKSNHSKTTVTIVNHLFHKKIIELFAERNSFAISSNQRMCTSLDDRLRGTLNKEFLLLAILDKHGHTLPVSREFESGKAGILLFIPSTGVVNTVFRFCLDRSTRTKLFSKDSQCTFSSRSGIIHKLGIVAKSSNLIHLVDCARRLNQILSYLAILFDSALGGECSALDIEFIKITTILTNVDHFVNAHLTFGDSRNTKRDGNLEIIDSTLGPVSVARISKVGYVDQPYKDTDDSDNLSKSVAEVVEFLLQRCGLRNLGSDALMNVADGGVGSSQDDHSFRTSSHYGCSREEHVRLVLKHSLLVSDNICMILANTLTLACQDGLVNSEAVAFDGNNPTIGRDAVTNGDRDDISWYKLFSLDTRDMSVSNDTCDIGGVFLESGDGFLGTAFLRHANNGIENENSQDL